MKPEQKKLVFILIIFVVLATAVFVGIAFVLLFMLRMNPNENQIIEDRTSYTYHMHKYDEVSDKSSSAMVSLPYSLDGEFLYYREEEDRTKHVLISKHGSNEYRCSGSCSCENDRRSSSVVVGKRGLFYLLSAASATAAFTLAKSHFREECVLEMADTCDPSSVSSEVEECDDIERKKMENEVGIVYYLCEGNCLPRMPGDPENKQKCNDLKTRDMIRVDENRVPNGYDLNEKVCEIFMGDHIRGLDAFCKNNGGPKQGMDCVGKIDEKNPSVRCMELEEVDEDEE